MKDEMTTRNRLRTYNSFPDKDSTEAKAFVEKEGKSDKRFKELVELGNSLMTGLAQELREEETMTDKARLTAQETRIKKLEKCLRAIRDFRPAEICYDEFAYKRLVRSYRKAAREGLSLWDTPGIPRLPKRVKR